MSRTKYFCELIKIRLVVDSLLSFIKLKLCCEKKVLMKRLRLAVELSQ